jgi:hypothetical protein
MILLALFLLTQSWQASASFMMLWLTGVYDILYYFVNKAPLESGYWTWLETWVWIFPAGFLTKITKVRINTNVLILNCLFGILVSVIIWMI